MSGIPAGAGSLLGKRLGKYEILALLALGGTAEIYLARIDGAAGFEKYVVVKCLHDHLNDDQDFVKMFLDEARIAAQLDHSNIVQTTELGEHDGRYYMVMEFLAGLSLAMVVRRVVERVPGGRLPTALALNMLAQAAGGLHYAHERTVNGKGLNIVHRDISPQNLVVSFEGVVKVVDFGIAKAEQRETKTRSGTIKGKFAYMSPEQCVAQNVDRRTDVFALGVIAHELLSGKRLFKRPSPYETYQAVIDCVVTPPSQINHELDPALDAVIMRALAKDKDQRYPTAEAFGDALAGYLHSRGKGAGPGDVARFFEANFTTEIEEHGARMRELIGGRESAEGMSWGEEEEERAREAAADHKRRETVDLTPAAAAAAARRGGGGGGGGGDDAMELGTMDLMRGSASSLSHVIDDLGVSTGDRNFDSAFDDSEDGDGGGGGDDDEGGMPADRTRIEANPLELLAEMDRQKANVPGVRPATAPVVAAPIPSLRGNGVRAPITPVPVATVIAPVAGGGRQATTPVPVATVIAPQAPASARPPNVASPNRGLPPIQPPPAGAGSGAPLRSVPSIRSGRLSQSMPLSTGTPAAGLPSAPASNPTSGTVPPPMGVPATGALPLPPAPPSSARGSAGPVAVGNGKFLAPAQLPTMIAELDESSNTGSGPQRPRAASGFDDSPATVMEEALPPTAFDGETFLAPNANQAQQQQPPQPQPYPQAPAPQQHYDLNGYMMTSGGYQAPPQPFASQQLPAGLGGPGGYAPHTPASGAYLSPAASLMSPVGAQYPNQVDWNAAAQKPARALKPWMMGALFAGAIGLALLLTVIIAKIAHHH